MKSRNLSKREKEIQDRFFEVLNILLENGTIKSLQAFCDEFGLHRPKYSKLKNNRNIDGQKGYKIIDMDAPSYLVEKYNISAEWLLTGKPNEMFKK